MRLSDPVPGYSRPELKNLLVTVPAAKEIAWEPYRPGVEIYRLYGNGLDGPSAALLRYEAGSAVPLHEHSGYEHILVLAGAQEDQNGVIETGTLVINPPGTRHAVSSRSGCIVLVIYERPVRFL
ncbi:MAG TPA: cupin domain-containing protein [Chthoniobacterales bacterium]